MSSGRPSRVVRWVGLAVARSALRRTLKASRSADDGAPLATVLTGPPGRGGQCGRVAQMVVQGNGLVTALTSATWETKRTKPRLDQWLRCPGVLPRSRT
jgi:hypothetical protein